MRDQSLARRSTFLKHHHQGNQFFATASDISHSTDVTTRSIPYQRRASDTSISTDAAIFFKTSPVLVDHTVKVSTDTITATTTAINTTGATFLIVAIACLGEFAPGALLTDSKGNTWTGLMQENAQNVGLLGQLQLYFCSNPTVGTGHTFQVTEAQPGNPIYPAIEVQAWSGLLNAVHDPNMNVGAIGSTNGVIAPGSATPTSNGELIITAALFNDTTSLSVGSGFTISDQHVAVSGSAYGIGMASLVQGTAGAVNPSWTWPSSTGPGYAVMAAFKSGTAPSTTMPGPSDFPGFTQIIADDFPGSSLDLGVWSGFYQDINQQYGPFLSSHGSVAGGVVTLSDYVDAAATGAASGTTRAGTGFHSNTQWTSGLALVRARCDAGIGVTMVMGLIAQQGGVWPPELDFYEDGLNTTNIRKLFQVTTHYDTANDQIYNVMGQVDATQYHIYGVQWNSAMIRYICDGVVWAQYPNPNPSGANGFTNPMGLFMQVAVLDWGARNVPVSGSTPPVVNMQIDWATVYN